MKNLSKILALLALPAIALAQTAPANTTLCAAMTATQTTICLQSTANVVSQTQIYVDRELMSVVLTGSQSLAAGPAQVPVARASRAAGSGPAMHSSGAVAWLALTPSALSTPGLNGFSPASNNPDVGPCVRAAHVYLPHIFPALGIMRDCNQNPTTLTGMWVNFNDGNSQQPSSSPQVALTTNGALVPATGNYIITKAGVLADTLAAPAAGIQDGTTITIASATAFAHTITATGLFSSGTASVNSATFAAQPGASLMLVAYQGKWLVLSAVGVTFA